MKEIDRIIIEDEKVYGDLKRCKICKINFSAFEECMICSLIIEKEEELGRKLTKEEFDKLFEFLK